MAYPQGGAGYKYKPAWLDRAQRAEGGSVGRTRLADPEGKPLDEGDPQGPPVVARAVPVDPDGLLKPRGDLPLETNRADPALLASVDDSDEFAPDAAQEAREAAAERTRRSASRLRRHSQPMPRMQED